MIDSHCHLADAAFALERWTEARQALEEALQLLRAESGDHWRMGAVLSKLGDCFLAEDETKQASGLYWQALELRGKFMSDPGAAFVSMAERIISVKSRRAGLNRTATLSGSLDKLEQLSAKLRADGKPEEAACVLKLAAALAEVERPQPAPLNQPLSECSDAEARC